MNRLPLLVLALTLACAAPAPAPAPEAAEPRVQVFYPKGYCDTDTVEVQVWLPSAGWSPHPEHPRVRTGRCYEERSAGLLNEIRLRCVDPDQVREASPWVLGVQVYPERSPAACNETGAD